MSDIGKLNEQLYDLEYERSNLREQVKTLLAACRAYVELFEESDMRPEDECHDLYSTFKDAIAKSDTNASNLRT